MWFTPLLPGSAQQQSSGGVPPGVLQLAPPRVWRFDGTAWVLTKPRRSSSGWVVARLRRYA